MPSNTGAHKPCKTCAASEVCLQSIIKTASCPLEEVQFKHPEPNNHLNKKE